MYVRTARTAEVAQQLQEPSGPAWNWTLYVAGVLVVCAIAFWIWREGEKDTAAAQQPRSWVAIGYHHQQRHLMYRRAQPAMAALTLLLAIAAISLVTQDLGGAGHMWAGVLTGGAATAAVAIVIARRRAHQHHTALYAALDGADDPARAAEFRALITDPKHDGASKHRRDVLTTIILGLSVGLLVTWIVS